MQSLLSLALLHLSIPLFGVDFFPVLIQCFFVFFFSRVPILYTSDLYVVSLISTVIPCATRPHLGRKRVRLKHSGPQLPQLNANSVRELTESTIFREDSAWQGSSVRCPIYSESAFIHVAD